MQLDEALRQISDIREQMARSGVFRGYRSLTVGSSGVVGLLAAAFQSRWVPSPESNLDRYLALWLGVACVSLVVAGSEMYWRARVAGSELARERTVLAVHQFLPCVVVGALLTLCIYRAAPQVAWMLPGLWSLVYGLGVFASYRLLPRQVSWVGSYYVLCGCGWLLSGQGANAFSPWQMGVSFGGGQLLGAAILYWTLEPPMTQHKPSESAKSEKVTAGAGRFSYEGLDRAMHEKARLGILASLAANPEGVLFNDLKELCSLTDGNLSRHLAVLKEAGLVETWKGATGPRPQTMYRLTADGRQRFADYISVLEKVVADAQAEVKGEVHQRRVSGSWSPA